MGRWRVRGEMGDGVSEKRWREGGERWREGGGEVEGGWG